MPSLRLSGVFSDSIQHLPDRILPCLRHFPHKERTSIVPLALLDYSNPGYSAGRAASRRTFLGRVGTYLEDLYVRPECRGKGYGQAILKRLAVIAVERGCGRLEWWCLDWNRSSIDFYLYLGAEPLSDWTGYRITGDTLTNLAK